MLDMRLWQKWQNLSQENRACLPSKSSLKHTRGAQTKTLSIWEAERGEEGGEGGRTIDAVHTQPTCTDTHTETVTHQVLLPEILRFVGVRVQDLRTFLCNYTPGSLICTFSSQQSLRTGSGRLTPRNVNTKTHAREMKMKRALGQTAPPLYCGVQAEAEVMWVCHREVSQNPCRGTEPGSLKLFIPPVKYTNRGGSSLKVKVQ